MADNFDLRKYITEAKLKIKVPVKEMARPAKEKYKLNSDFPNLQDRIENSSNYKLDRKQQVINYFVKQGEEQGIDPMEVELLKSQIEKNSAPGVNWSFTPDIRNQLLKATSVKPTAAADEEPGEDDIFMTPSDAEDLFIGKSKLRGKAKGGVGDEEEPSAADIAKIKSTPMTPAGSKAGEFFVDNADLIARIIKQYAQSSIKVGKIKEAEDGGMSSADFKSAQAKSKETAAAGLPDLIQKLVDKIEILKDEDYDAYIKVLNDLDKYKFGATNTKGAMKMILKALGEPTLPAMGSKRKKKSDDDELKALGIDDEPIKIDDEEEI
jgi:hypothetical protein